jgi:opacity protein-like surface antigen
MRRFVRTLAICAAATAASAAAAEAQTIGFKLGAAFSNLQIEDATTTQNRITGFAGGGHIRFGVSGRLGLQAELLSVTRGSDIEGVFSRDVRLEYIEIPVLLHVPLTMGTNFAPYVFGGPGVAFEVRCRTTDVTGNSVDCSDVNPFERNSTDFGLTAGGGFAFAMGPGALLVEGRYTWGMSDIDAGDAQTVKNRSAAVMAGYEIPLGRRW